MSESSSSSAGETGRITIDLKALAANWQSLANMVSPAECAAVVKADAYGLGARHVVPALAQAGCTSFFVATFNEAKEIKPLVGTGRIFILDGLLPGSASAVADLGVIPVLSTLDEIGEWQYEAKARSQKLPSAIHVDSGLHRLGLAPGDVARLAQDQDVFADLHIDLVMSHLASADVPDAPENQAQLTAFGISRSLLPDAPASLAASDGLMLGSAFHFDVVRPGYALYGGQAFQGAETPVKPVVEVTTKILQVRSLVAGDKVGYSATFTAPHDMTIAILAAGYADGIPRSASAPTGKPAGVVAIQGHLAPLVGRVSMDLIAVDVSHVPTHLLTRGADVELIGPTCTLDMVGQAANTIGYEILTRLSPRFERIYLDKGDNA